MQAEPSITLTQLEDFGGVAAENDDLLSKFFVETSAYRAIADGRRFIVVGRKGTGKTAIYKELQQGSSSGRKAVASGLEFSDYPWGAHQEVANTLASQVERYSYTESWRFLILVELSKLIFRTGRHHGRQARRVRRFLKRNWGTTQFEVRRVFGPAQYDLDLAPSILRNSLGRVARRRVPRRELGGVLSTRNDWLKRSIERFTPRDKTHFILFDGLDIAYNAVDDDYKQRIVGLLLAARSIYVWSRTQGLAVLPVVFLRSDIYEQLVFADQNKMTEDNVQLLAWDDSETGENSLKTLMNQRIRVQTGYAGDRDPWDLVFDASPMRGTQKKYRYLVDRTYLRPRDMIRFCTVCLQNAHAEGHPQIINDDIYNAREAYSDYVFAELNNEISALDANWSEVLEVLRDIRKITFERVTFDEAFNRRMGTDSSRTPDGSLRLLYQFGVVGFVKKGGGGRGGSEIAWQYRDPKQRFDPGARNFRVHWSLKEYLDLVE